MKNHLFTQEESTAVFMSSDPVLVQKEFEQVPGLIAYYNTLLAQALRTKLLADAQRDSLFAELSIKVRAQLERMGGKVTEKIVECEVITSSAYNAAVLECIDAEVEYTRAKGFVAAISAKKDMLQQIGAKLRLEMEHNAVVRFPSE